MLMFAYPFGIPRLFVWLEWHVEEASELASPTPPLSVAEEIGNRSGSLTNEGGVEG